MKFVPQRISRSIGRKVLVTKKNSPHIFFAAGVVGVVTTTVLACRATLKLEKMIDEIKLDVDSVSDMKPNSTESNHDKDVMYVYGKGALKLGRLYAPSLVVGTVSIAALTGSHVQLTRRNAALTITLAAVSKAYEEYRLRVQEEIGEKKELELHRALSDEEVDVDGKKKNIKVTNPYGLSPYARFFDEYSTEWKKNAEHNRIFIQCQQNYANHKLKARGHVFLNEVYDSLGLERSQAGAVVGWVMDGEGDNYIDFGLFEANNRRFVNQLEWSLILDFNVDGVVYDKI